MPRFWASTLPGTTGFGVLVPTARNLQYVTSGTIRTDKMVDRALPCA